MSEQAERVTPAAPKGFGEQPWERALLLLPIVIGVMVRTAGAGMRPVWDDEAFSYFMAAGGVSRLFAQLPLDAQPPLYYLLDVLSLGLFGQSETALRLPSLLCGLALIPAVAVIAGRLWNRGAGITAAALVAVSPLLSYESVEARSYSQLALLILVGAWCYWNHFQAPTWRSAIPAFLAGTAALYTHYFGIFVLLFAGACFLWKARSRWPQALAPFVLTAAACVPWLLLLQQQQQRYGSKQFTADLSLPATLVRSAMVLGTGGFNEGISKLVGAGAFLLVVAAAAAVVISTRKERCPAFPLLLAGLLYGVLHLGLALHRWPVRDAYLAIVTPAVLMLVAGAVSSLRAAPARWAMLAAALAGLLPGLTAVASGKAHPNPDYGALARRVAEADADGVLLARPWGDLACYAFYDRGAVPLGIYAVSPEAPTEEALVVRRDLESTAEIIRTGRRVCVVGKVSGAPGFKALGAQLAEAGYQSRADELIGDARFTLWERKDRLARGITR
ncbi:MAG: glycosyltransferase family 39 protein [Actinomycetota bacterium]